MCPIDPIHHFTSLQRRRGREGRGDGERLGLMMAGDYPLSPFPYLHEDKCWDSCYFILQGELGKLFCLYLARAHSGQEMGQWMALLPSDSMPAHTRVAHLDELDIGVLLGQFFQHLIHLPARLRPRRPEMHHHQPTGRSWIIDT